MTTALHTRLDEARKRLHDALLAGQDTCTHRTAIAKIEHDIDAASEKAERERSEEASRQAAIVAERSDTSPPIAPTRLQPPEAIKLCLAEGVSLDRITMSSDGNGSMPVFNERRELVGLTAASPVSLFNALCNIVKAGILPLEDALRPVTINPATSLKLPNKGRLAAGFDADILILNQELKIEYVFAKGRCMLDSDAVVTGVFEKR